MYIVVGLGNPGKEYRGTRHNAGFEVIDRLAEDLRIDVGLKKHKGISGRGVIGGEKVVLLKPLTYMNLSGESVREVVDFYKVSAENLIVIFDDISLEPGQLRIRTKGSAGGHNGIKSLISHLGTDQFLRLKVGIGEKPRGWDLADYVLSRFNKDEQQLMEETYSDGSKAVQMMIETGIVQAMNQYNVKKTNS